MALVRGLGALTSCLLTLWCGTLSHTLWGWVLTLTQVLVWTNPWTWSYLCANLLGMEGVSMLKGILLLVLTLGGLRILDSLAHQNPSLPEFSPRGFRQRGRDLLRWIRSREGWVRPLIQNLAPLLYLVHVVLVFLRGGWVPEVLGSYYNPLTRGIGIHDWETLGLGSRIHGATQSSLVHLLRLRLMVTVWGFCVGSYLVLLAQLSRLIWVFMDRIQGSTP